jgi:hypothetical protein
MAGAGKNSELVPEMWSARDKSQQCYAIIFWVLAVMEDGKGELYNILLRD